MKINFKETFFKKQNHKIIFKIEKNFLNAIFINMSEFELFDIAVKQKNDLETKSQSETFSLENKEDCAHENCTNEKGVSICFDCGRELSFSLINEKEVKYYGQGDTRHLMDASRIQLRKPEDKGIYHDVENMGFSEHIIAQANKIYTDVAKQKIFRGNSRKAIVCACVFFAFVQSECFQSHQKLITIFNLSQKAGLKGLKFVMYATRAKDKKIVHITPVHLITEIMDMFQTSSEQKEEVINIHNKVQAIKKLNKSRPQSISAGVIYYWIRLKGKNITLKNFSEKVNLSALTILNIAKQISVILNTPNVVLSP